MRAEKPREIAVNVLSERNQGAFVETLLDAALAAARLKPEDRRFLQELVYGVVRWELTLDWLIGQKTGGKPQKEIVQTLLRLALYQMFWLDRVPSYAAVNETVEICKQRGLEPQAKFINAVLRGYGREGDLTRRRLHALRDSSPSIGFSHPEWLCRRWMKQWGGEKTRSLLEWNNTPPPTYARVNTLKTGSDSLAKAWANEGVGFEAAAFPWVPDGTLFRLLNHPPLATLPSFLEGYFYVQDPSTLLAGEMLQAQRGETIMDLCAAPGGKTTYIAQKMKNEGAVHARDLESSRLKLVQENAARLGATAVSIGGSEAMPASYDRVLVDAPCSNTGVMRRRIELRWRIKLEEISRLASTQLTILNSGAERTRPGGVLVYSTCSLEREENQQVVGKFLALDNRFRLDAESELVPMTDGVDGAYCARLVRRA